VTVERARENQYHDCEICQGIRKGCAADEAKPQNCEVCGNKGLLVSGDGERATVCPACPKGERMRLWVIHEKAAGHCVDGISV
jgi:hypothetical protein